MVKGSNKKLHHCSITKIRKMKTTSPSLLLKEKIQLKEIELSVEFILLEDQMKLFASGLQPLKLLKKMFTGSNSKSEILDTVLGMASGYIVRKALIHSSSNPIVRIFGTIAGMGVANMITKHPEGIKTIGAKILKMIFAKKENVNE